MTDEPTTSVLAAGGPPKTLEDVVKAFLGLALVQPDKLPKRKRDIADNQAMIIGYSRAQHDLRKLLEGIGRQDLAAIINPKSERPLKVGDTNLWVR